MKSCLGDRGGFVAGRNQNHRKQELAPGDLLLQTGAPDNGSSSISMLL